MAGKFHELLAVVNDRMAQFTKILDEAKNVFQKHSDKFDGLIRNYAPKADNGTRYPSESKQVATTVKQKLQHVRRLAVPGIDAVLSKEETNSSGTAKALLVINGEELGTYSATALLSLENNLTKLRGTYNAIPTRDAGLEWSPQQGEVDIFRTPEVQSSRIEAINTPSTLHEALALLNEHHAPQVQLSKEPTAVGIWNHYQLTGRISSAQKADLLDNIDAVIDGVKRARAQANNVKAVNVKLADNLFDIIHGDVL